MLERLDAGSRRRLRHSRPVLALWATGIAFLPLLLSGCRQTPGSTTSALQPLTTPSGSIGTPTLLPFGSGDARVAPPPTGAITAPNNYMGGVTQTPPLGTPPAGGLAAISPNQTVGNLTSGGSAGEVIGSGIQQTEFRSGAPIAPQTTTAIRSGGMNVIDLTSAPPPPGYMPAPAPSGSPVLTTQSRSSQFIADPSNGMPAVNLQPIASAPNLPSPPRVRLSNHSAGMVTTFSSAPSTAASPSTAGIGQAQPASTLTTSRPSTAESSGDLQWRNPAAGF